MPLDIILARYCPEDFPYLFSFEGGGIKGVRLIIILKGETYA